MPIQKKNLHKNCNISPRITNHTVGGMQNAASDVGSVIHWGVVLTWECNASEVVRIQFRREKQSEIPVRRGKIGDSEKIASKCVTLRRRLRITLWG